MSAQVVLYNVDEQDEALAEKVDMSIQASMARVRVVFLNWFVSSLLVSDVFVVRINMCVETVSSNFLCVGYYSKAHGVLIMYIFRSA